MKVILDTLITAIDGTPIAEGFTVASACIHALTTMQPNDEKLMTERKIFFFKTALKLQGVSEADLTAEEITAIKERVGVQYSAIVVGRVCQALDPASV